MDEPLLEDLVRRLIAQASETRGLDYKGPMAWTGTKGTVPVLENDPTAARGVRRGRRLI